MVFAQGTTTEQGKEPYKYNGKELDAMHGLNWYDYWARHYAPAIARFSSIDPLAKKFYSISPYAYVNNSPLKYIYPIGMEFGDPLKKKDPYLSELASAAKQVLESVL